MTGATLTTTIDDRQARRAFAALQKLMADTTPVMRAIGVGFSGNVQDCFQTR